MRASVPFPRRPCPARTTCPLLVTSYQGIRRDGIHSIASVSIVRRPPYPSHQRPNLNCPHSSTHGPPTPPDGAIESLRIDSVERWISPSSPTTGPLRHVRRHPPYADQSTKLEPLRLIPSILRKKYILTDDSTRRRSSTWRGLPLAFGPSHGGCRPCLGRSDLSQWERYHYGSDLVGLGRVCVELGIENSLVRSSILVGREDSLIDG